jgi:hypothetical protein
MALQKVPQIQVASRVGLVRTLFAAVGVVRLGLHWQAEGFAWGALGCASSHNLHADLRAEPRLEVGLLRTVSSSFLVGVGPRYWKLARVVELVEPCSH